MSMEHIKTELENLEREYRASYRRLLTEFFTSLTYRLARKYNTPKLSEAARMEVVAALTEEMREGQDIFEKVLEAMDAAYEKKAGKTH